MLFPKKCCSFAYLLKKTLTNTMRKQILLLLIFICNCTLFAASSDFSFRHITMDDGLS